MEKKIFTTSTVHHYIAASLNIWCSVGVSIYLKIYYLVFMWCLKRSGISKIVFSTSGNNELELICWSKSRLHKRFKRRSQLLKPNFATFVLGHLNVFLQPCCSRWWQRPVFIFQNAGCLLFWDGRMRELTCACKGRRQILTGWAQRRGRGWLLPRSCCWCRGWRDRSPWSPGLWAQIQVRVGAHLLVCLFLISTFQTTCCRQSGVQFFKKKSLFRKKNIDLVP